MTFIAIGGAEDKTGGMDVLRRVVAESVKGNKSRICVITTASIEPDKKEAEYTHAFNTIGVSTCDILHIGNRAQANDLSMVEKINNADIIFFTGGDQLRLSSILGGTATLSAIKEKWRQDAVIAGTSAGAAAASEVMICGGRPEQAMEKGHIMMAGGLGFAENIVFDTHFSERNRLSRLFCAVAANPANIGIGLDEDTGVILRRDGSMDVIGSGTVTIVDGKTISHSNIAEARVGQKVSVDGLTPCTLKAGDRYNFKP